MEEIIKGCVAWIAILVVLYIVSISIQALVGREVFACVFTLLWGFPALMIGAQVAVWLKLI